MTTEDLTAGSDRFAGRQLDLARAAYWAQDLHESLERLNYLVGHANESLQDRGGPSLEAVVADLHRDAVSDYMTGAEEDPEERADYKSYLNAVDKYFDEVRTAVIYVLGNVERTSYLISPPVWAKDDPWTVEKSPEALRPEESKARPVFNDKFVYSVIQERLDGHLADFHARVTAQPDNNTLLVEVTSGLDIDCENGPERFRVTVERTEAGESK